MKFPWYAHHIPDYESKTAHLSMIKHGAYRLLIDHYYRVGGPLKANASDLLRVCRAVDEAERQAVMEVLSEFFTERNGHYHLSRADEELEKRAAISAKRAAAGKAGGSKPKSKRQSNGEANGKHLLEQTESNSPPHVHQQSYSSPTEKNKTARERAGVRKAPAPLAAPIQETEPTPGWEAEFPNSWGALRTELFETVKTDLAWQNVFADCRAVSDSELICPNMGLHNILKSKFGEEGELLPKHIFKAPVQFRFERPTARH